MIGGTHDGHIDDKIWCAGLRNDGQQVDERAVWQHLDLVCNGLAVSACVINYPGRFPTNSTIGAARKLCRTGGLAEIRV